MHSSRYIIHHITDIAYSEPVYDSTMVLRMAPRQAEDQRRDRFELLVEPVARLKHDVDSFGNVVYRCHIPEAHQRLTISAQAEVEVVQRQLLPQALSLRSWETLDDMARSEAMRLMLDPSHFARPTKLLRHLAVELALDRSHDPLTLLRRLNADLYQRFAYVPNRTNVDSPIDEALRLRQGVCQDFAHIMISLGRALGIPCRYVSGYVYYDPSDSPSDGATHAWIEALLPELGWVGFDPTNNSMSGVGHIRVAIGRDYADVPPNQGVFKGSAHGKLKVRVNIRRIV